MRNIVLCSFLFILSRACAAQDTSSLKSPKKVSFQQRSRDQKAGGILLSAGGAVGLLGTLIADATHFGSGLMVTVVSLGTYAPKYKSYTGGYIVSGVALVSGIYLITASGKNKRKAKIATLTMNMEKADILKSNAFYKQSFPTVGVRIKL